MWRNQKPEREEGGKEEGDLDFGAGYRFCGKEGSVFVYFFRGSPPVRSERWPMVILTLINGTETLEVWKWKGGLHTEGGDGGSGSVRSGWMSGANLRIRKPWQRY